MAEVIVFLVGAALISLALIEAVSTAMAIHGGGPASSRLARLLWLAPLRQRLRNLPRLLPYAGPGVVLLTLLMWWLLLWLGWLLVHLSFDAALFDSGGAHRFWPLPFSANRSGPFDNSLSGITHQLVPAVAWVMVVLFMVLSVTYMRFVMSAVMVKRQLAFHILSIGSTPEQFIRSSWNGNNFQGLEKHLISITPSLILLAQQHVAYPALHCFCSGDRDASIAMGIAVLDESLALILHGVPGRAQPDPMVLLPARRAILKYLRTIQPFAPQAPDQLPIPRLDALRMAGVPVVDDEIFLRRLERLLGLRRQVYALIHSEGWVGNDVWSVGKTPAIRPTSG